MQAKELLQRHQQGERDFRGLNLQDADFRGADLAGADFSNCRLQGTNFTRANLTGARFCAAKTGLSRIWAIVLALGGLLLTGIVSLVATFFVAMFLGAAGPVFASQQEVATWVIAITALYITLAIAATRKGLAVTWQLLVAALTGAIAVAIAATVFAAFFPANTAIVDICAVIAKVGVATSAAGVGMVMALGTGVIAGAFAGVEIVPGLLIALIAVFSASIGASIGAVGASVGIVYGGGGNDFGAGYWFVTIGMPVVALIQGFYLGFRPLRGDRRDRWLRYLTLQLVSIFGTRFTQANLTDADFSAARLKHANFQKALCDRVCFRDASYLSLACDCQPIANGQFHN